MILKKSQIAVEFLIFIGLALLSTVFFTSASLSQLKDFQDKREYLFVKDFALKLQTEVYLAATSEDGYRREFTIPDKLENLIDYNVTIKNSTLIVYSGKSLHAVSIPQVNGNFIKNTNTITKTGGVVNLN